MVVEKADERHEMKAGGRARAVRQRGGNHLDSLGVQKAVDKRNAELVGPVAVTDQQSFGIEPEHVSGFGSALCRVCRDFVQRGNLKVQEESGLMSGFGDSIGLTGAEDDHAVIGGERGIVGVDSIEGESGIGREFDDFGASGLQLAAECVVLRLSGCEVWGVMEPELLPTSGALELIPSGGTRKTDQDALKRGDHGVSVEDCFGC